MLTSFLDILIDSPLIPSRMSRGILSCEQLKEKVISSTYLVTVQLLLKASLLNSLSNL